MPQSRYDLLHDRYSKLASDKSGTRYERLMALVWLALHEHDNVVHDMKMVGDSTVSHQIDVSITREGIDRRILIECKDFDVSSKKVGLDVLRSFRSVIEDTKADEGFVVTCVGFTRDAQKYAKAKGIKLLVLRKFEVSDQAGRVKEIHFRVTARTLDRLTITALCFEEGELAKFNAELKAAGIVGGGIRHDDPVVFVKAKDRVPFITHIEKEARRLTEARPAGKFIEQVQPDGWALSIAGGPTISFDLIEISFDLYEQTDEFVITSSRIAELLLTGFGASDLIIYGDQLERHRIDATGQVHRQ